jgi:hypothetical protein
MKKEGASRFSYLLSLQLAELEKRERRLRRLCKKKKKKGQ